MSGMLPEEEARFRVQKLVVAYDEFLAECANLAYTDCDRLQLPGDVRASIGLLWARGIPAELSDARLALKR